MKEKYIRSGRKLRLRILIKSDGGFPCMTHWTNQLEDLQIGAQGRVHRFEEK